MSVLLNKNENVKQTILDAASEIFVAEGFGSVSMRKIARKIGYTPTTIYLYFDDKADLFNQICEKTFAQMTRNLIAISKLSVSPLERLRLGLFEYIHFGLKHPNHYAIVFNTTSSPEPAKDFQNSQGEATFDTLRNSVSACMADGAVVHGDVELTSQTLWACIHGVTSLLITQEGFPFVGRQALTESVVDTIIAGIRH